MLKDCLGYGYKFPDDTSVATLRSTGKALMIFSEFYFIYLPHLALPLAASCTVIPLEQELKNSIENKIITVKKSGFFITVRFDDETD